MGELTSTVVVRCSKCCGLLLAKENQKTRSCPYCGATVVLERARKIASAQNSAEASIVLRQLKSGEAASGKKS